MDHGVEVDGFQPSATVEQIGEKRTSRAVCTDVMYNAGNQKKELFCVLEQG
jgi:hypothetical protein